MATFRSSDSEGGSRSDSESSSESEEEGQFECNMVVDWLKEVLGGF